MDTINIFEEKINNKIDLKLDKNTTINIFNQKINSINITILDNIKVTINEFNNNQNDKRIINFNIKNNSVLIYNLSNVINEKNSLLINIKYEGQNSKVITNINSIVKGYEKISINGKVENEYKENELLENVKIILIENGTCEVNPDMIIDTKEVIANHKVAISPLRESDLIYLMSKGITRKSAETLLKKSFLISNISDKILKNLIDI